MKKALIIMGLFVAFLITYFLQSNFFNWFTIGGIKPNIFIILVLFVSLFAGLKPAIGFGLFAGLFLDIVLGKNLGNYTIMLTIVAILGYFFDKNFSKDSRFTIMLMVACGTIIFEIGCYILNIFIINVNVEILQFIKALLIETLFNVIITAIIYPIMKKIGYKIEDEFKEQKILTRYF